jgi:quercetin dioxygenase-like cupin family protein
LALGSIVPLLRKRPILHKKEGVYMENLIGEVLNLAGLADYQTGSIVSKEIIKKGTGTVTLFAFDEGQGLSEHTAPFDALVYVLEGKAEITISGKAFNLTAGEMIIMPANDPHALKAVNPFKMALVMIKS